MFVIPEPAEQFRFKVGEDEYSMPQVNDLPMADALRIRQRMAEAGDDASDVMAQVAIDLFEQYAPGVVDKLTMGQFKALADAYMGDGEAVGESSGSSN